MKCIYGTVILIVLCFNIVALCCDSRTFFPDLKSNDNNSTVHETSFVDETHRSSTNSQEIKKNEVAPEQLSHIRKSQSIQQTMNEKKMHSIDTVTDSYLPTNIGTYYDWQNMSITDGNYSELTEGAISESSSTPNYAPSNTMINEWRNPGNVYFSDDSYTTAKQSDTFMAVTFNIQDLNSATITGIEVTFETNTGAPTKFLNISLAWNNKANRTDVKRLAVSTTVDSNTTLGGSTDNWGRTWSPVDFSNTNFGVHIQVDNSGPTTIFLDYLQVKVYYQLNYFSFDREFSFSSAAPYDDNLELAIKSGTLTEETLNIDYWNTIKNDWKSLVNLTQSKQDQWINISLEGLFDSHTMNFRFHDELNDPTDSIQHIWQIDSIYLTYNLKARHFQYRKNITLNSTLIPNDLYNFPFLVDILDLDLHNHAQVTGNDILFTTSSGIKLAHEIELYNQSYNTTHSHLVSWVKIPELLSAYDTIISMVFGNSTLSSQEQADAVWESNFAIVHHLEEDPTSVITDSTTSYNMTSLGNMSGNELRDSICGKGVEFGSDDYYNSTLANFTLDTSFSLSMWINANNVTGTFRALFALEGTDNFVRLLITRDGNFRFRSASNITTFGTIENNSYYYLHLVYNYQSTEVKIYLNSTLFGTSYVDVLPRSGFFIIGYNYEGYIDEWKLATSVRTASWIETEFQNHHNENNFYVVGPINNIKDTAPPIIEQFGVEHTGNGNPIFWSLVTDDFAGVANVTIALNGTKYLMNLNSSGYWIYTPPPPIVYYQDSLIYQITNATDYYGKSISSPSNQEIINLNLDTVLPEVLDWEYFPDIGEYGTFKANTTDQWGIIDTVTINITSGVSSNIGKHAVMQSLSYEGGYINDSLILTTGTIYFRVTVNDTAGNSFTSPEHQGYVPDYNTPPEVSDIRILPDLILSNTSLQLNYTYFDLDGDEELGTTIKWYQNGNYKSTHDQKTTIDASYLIRGDTWYVKVKPRDGKEFGVENTSETVTIQNTPPQLSSVYISPQNPITSSSLSASYLFSDYDGDSENTTSRMIIWYKDSTLIHSLNESLTVASGNTSKGQTWYFRIRVYDSFNLSKWYTSTEITINNAKPTVDNPTFNKTENISTDNDLSINYTYNDIDNDTEIISEAIVYWFKDGEYQSYLTNQTILLSSSTGNNEFWYYIIRVFDGTNYSSNKTSQGISIGTINNNPPVADNLTILGHYSQDDLQGIYDYSDDLYPEAGSEIRWWKSTDNGTTWILVSSYNDELLIFAEDIEKGEHWKFGVHPKDGLEFGNWVNSSVTIIQNTHPVVDFINIIDASNIFTTNTIDITISASDYDNDPIVLYNITWYMNDTIQEHLGNSTSILPENTSKNEIWFCRIYAYDGFNWSTSYLESTHITIKNSLPEVTNISLTGGTNTDEPIVLSYDFIDPDNDDDQSYITWYIGGTANSSFELLLPSSEIVAGDVVYCRIIPFDGDNTGTEILTSESNPNIIKGLVVVGNTAPIILNGPNLESLANFTVSNSIFVNYTAYDRDGDDEQGSSLYNITIVMENGYYLVEDAEYRWFKNGKLQQSLTNTHLDSSLLVKHDVWIVSVRVIDNYGYYSDWYNSSEITIQNSVPIIQDITWKQSYPTAADNIELQYDYFDADGDNEGTSHITWYINGYKVNNDNKTTLSFTFTKREDMIYVTILPFDQEQYGLLVNSSKYTVILTIVNAKPIVSDIRINDGEIITSNNQLTLNWTYFDYDNDSQNMDQLIVYWFINGIYNQEYDNLSLIVASELSKDQVWRAILRVHDGYAFSKNYTSPLVIIQNSAIDIEWVQLNDGSANYYINTAIEVLFDYSDPDGDSYTDLLVYWYINGQLNPSHNNQTQISSFTFQRNTVIYCEIQFSDDNGDTWSNIMTSQEIQIVNKAPIIDDLSYIYENELIDPVLTNRDFFIEDEMLSVQYDFFDLENDTDQSLIFWYRNGNLVAEYQGLLEIPASATQVNDVWYVKIIPSDGIDNGNVFQSQNITILGRPEIHDYGYIDTSQSQLKEGQYSIYVQTNVSSGQIATVSYKLTIHQLNITLPVEYVSNTNGTGNFWILEDVDLLEILKESEYQYSDFELLIRTNITVEIIVDYQVTRMIDENTLNFHILQMKTFVFQIEDTTPPRVSEVKQVWNGNPNRPDNITFYCVIEEFGYGINEVYLYYHFRSSKTNQNTSTLTKMFLAAEDDIPFNKSQMTRINTTYFAVTIPYAPKESVDILYKIEVSDLSGNINNDAYPEGMDPENISRNRFIYIRPSVFPIELLLVIIIFLIILSAVGVRYFSSTELVGLDVELVIKQSKEVKEEDIMSKLNLYSYGIVVSMFDQIHGPIPVLVDPPFLKDNFQKLVELSDNAYRTRGYAEGFEDEISTVFEFQMGPNLKVTSLTYAFALERPESRGGAENMTLNILLNKNISQLILQFTDYLDPKVHDIHIHLDKHFSDKETISNMIDDLRKFITTIIIAYEDLYGTTEYDEND